tara:strand:+ start:281 stop:475 length:195 start_codon:yes stop_codon:yes gene_type:complete
MVENNIIIKLNNNRKEVKMEKREKSMMELLITKGVYFDFQIEMVKKMEILNKEIKEKENEDKKL